MATIEKIDEILNIILGQERDEEREEENILKVMALFDTSHDFGKYSICYDTLTAAIRSNINTSQYKNQRMGFSSLSTLVFGIGSDALSKRYGSLRTPAEYYSSALQAKDLENSFMLYAENYRNNNSGRIIHRTRVNGVGGYENDKDYYIAVHTTLSAIYSNDIDGNALVPLLVDTQKKIYKYKNFTTQFMVPILRESVYDAAPKLKKDDQTGKNVYYETYRNNNNNTVFYDYSNTLQPGGVFVGNIPVSLGPIDQVELTNNNKYKIEIKINNGSPVDVIGNAGAKHKNSITVLKREIDGNQKTPCTEIGTTMYPLQQQVATYPYSGYVTSDKNASTNTGCPIFNDNNNKFTQKRTGDGNQASICKLVNSGDVTVSVTNESDTNGSDAKDINKLVLVTIDRMLYAVALMLNIPVIFEHHKPESMKCYIPNGETVVATGVATGTTTGAATARGAARGVATGVATGAATPRALRMLSRNNKGGSTSITSNNPHTSEKITNNYFIQNKEQSGGVDTINALTTAAAYVVPHEVTSMLKHLRGSFNYGYSDLELKYILDTPNYILALTPFIHEKAYNRILSSFKGAFEAIVAEPYITCSNTINGIDDPKMTNFLRNYTETDTQMDALIGPDNTGSQNNIDIITLQSKIIGWLGNVEYKLIYKYNQLTINNRDTYNDRSRVLQIQNLTSMDWVNKDNTSDPFGIKKLKNIFDYTSVSHIDNESTNYSLLDRIEEMMTGLIEGSQQGGLSDSSPYISPLGSPLASPDYVDQNSYSSLKSISNPNSKDSVDTFYTVPLGSKSESDIKTSDDNKAIRSKYYPYSLLTKYNNYYAVAFNYVKTQEKLGQEINVELSNEFTLFAYLWMFNNYVIHVCIDDEETAIAYDEWTVKDDNRHVLVPTHKSLYLLFNYLVTTFKTENKLPFLLTDLEQVLYNENDYMYFQLQQIKDYVLKDDYISVIDINDKSSISKYSNYDDIKKLITDMNKKEVVVCDDMNKKGKFDDLLEYAIDNMLTRYGMFYMNTDYLNYIGEDKQSQQVMAKKSKSGTSSRDSQEVNDDDGNITSTSPDSKSTLGGNRRKKSKKHKKIRKYKQTKRHIRRRNKKNTTKRKNTRKYKKSNNIKKTRKKNKKTKRNSK